MIAIIAGYKQFLVIRILKFLLEALGSQHHTKSKLVGSLLCMGFIHLELKTEALFS